MDLFAALPYTEVDTLSIISQKNSLLFNLLYEMTVSEFLRDIQRHARVHRFGCGAFLNRGVHTEQNFSKNSTLFNLKWKFENFSMAFKGMHECMDLFAALSHMGWLRLVGSLKS